MRSIQVYEGDGVREHRPVVDHEPALAYYEVGMINDHGIFNEVRRDTLREAFEDALVLFVDVDEPDKATAQVPYNRLLKRIKKINTARTFCMSERAGDGVRVFIRRRYA